MRISAYMRASTTKQDANRARQELLDFAQRYNKSIDGFFVENCSGTLIDRPELTHMINMSCKNDVILVESIDRLTRLTNDDYRALKRKIEDTGARVVAVDMPTTHVSMRKDADFNDDSLTDAITSIINNMMIDVAAVISRKDYELRQKRTLEGLAKARAEGKLLGRRPDKSRHELIESLLLSGVTYNKIQEYTKASHTTIAKISKAIKKSKTQ